MCTLEIRVGFLNTVGTVSNRAVVAEGCTWEGFACHELDLLIIRALFRASLEPAPFPLPKGRVLVRAGVGGGVCSNSWYSGAADAPASVALSEPGLVPLSGVPVAVTAGPGLTGRPGELCREQAGGTR